MDRAKDEGRACRVCNGQGWVCEAHRDHAWESATKGTCCGGAGAPCGACNLEMASAGYVERERQRIIAWLRAEEEHYSGWNPHDEQFDDGWNGATRWIATALEMRTDTQGTEAQRAETGTGSVHDGPVAESDAPKGDAQ